MILVNVTTTRFDCLQFSGHECVRCKPPHERAMWSAAVDLKPGFQIRFRNRTHRLKHVDFLFLWNSGGRECVALIGRHEASQYKQYAVNKAE